MPTPKIKPEILFVSHNASRSGAPLILLEMIRAFKAISDIPFAILIMEDGSLRAEFEKLGPTELYYSIREARQSRTETGFKKQILRAKMFLKYSGIRKRIGKPGLIFLNTITNGHIQRKLVTGKARHITYVHELATSIREGTSAVSLNAVLEHTDLFLTGSDAVRRNLVGSYGIPPHKINVLYSSIPIVKRDRSDHADFVMALKRKSGIAEDAVVVGLMGNSEWRKGFDLFIPLVSSYFELFPSSKVHFIWKGYNSGDNRKYYHDFDSLRAGISVNISLLPHDNDNIPTMAGFDIHLLLSREDPYPIVVLEAASFAIPTICFADAGGAIEFVGNDAGAVIPFGNLVALSRSINLLVENVEMRRRLGNRAQEKVSQLHGSEDAAAIVQNLFQEKSEKP